MRGCHTLFHTVKSYQRSHLARHTAYPFTWKLEWEVFSPGCFDCVFVRARLCKWTQDCIFLVFPCVGILHLFLPYCVYFLIFELSSGQSVLQVFFVCEWKYVCWCVLLPNSSPVELQQHERYLQVDKRMTLEVCALGMQVYAFSL